MRKKSLLTTGDVAAHCEVAVKTVNNWIKRGKLKTATTAGGHHRIHVDNFNEFLREHNLPLWGEQGTEEYRVLIVDDEPDVVRVLVKCFRTGPYEVTTASDGFEAGIQVNGFRPHLIILDLVMPNLDGFRVCRLIKANPELRDIKILILTGHASDENRQKALEGGADYFMTKPFRPEELRRTVEELLSGKASISLTA